MKKRLLVLGGSEFQIPLIRLAKAHGHEVITCDFLPSNPGHAYADSYHNVSTTEREAVLALARRLGVDAIASMSSEPAVRTVAYVAENLGMPGARSASVDSLTDKQSFRSLMRDAGLPTPRYVVLRACDVATARDTDFEVSAAALAGLRVIVKPVDGWGSKGITVLERDGEGAGVAIQHALAHSMTGRCIVEEYLEGEQMHGDAYLQGGRLVYQYLGDHTFYTRTRSRIPISTRWPTKHGEAILSDLQQQIEVLSRASGYTDGSINIEARVSRSGRVYIIEMAPRNGGNFVPIMQHRLTGFDFVSRVLDLALGESSTYPPSREETGVGAGYLLHADRDGRLMGIEFSDEIRDKVFSLTLFRQPGEPVGQHTDSSTTIGVALLEFDSVAERERLMDGIEAHVMVHLE